MENQIKQLKKEINFKQWSLIKGMHEMLIERQGMIDQLKIKFKDIMTRLDALEEAIDEKKPKLRVVK